MRRHIPLTILSLLASASALSAMTSKCSEHSVAPPTAESLAAVPLQPLYRFSTAELGTAIHPAAGLVFENFWRWYDMPQRVRREALDIAGGVVVAGQPHEYTLQVRQRGEDQVYLLDIESFGKLMLTAYPPSEGRQELEFDFERSGEERARTGCIMTAAR